MLGGWEHQLCAAAGGRSPWGLLGVLRLAEAAARALPLRQCLPWPAILWTMHARCRRAMPRVKGSDVLQLTRVGVRPPLYELCPELLIYRRHPQAMSQPLLQKGPRITKAWAFYGIYTAGQ